ncbi:MAG: peptidase T [Pirellulales bacterium]|nr:peptidase T [Pirellulales bacterium]
MNFEEDAVTYQIDRDDMVRRFLSYARVWTTSEEDSSTIPSTQRQFDLARILVRELAELGLVDVRLDEHCYVYGSLPERFTANASRTGKAPTIGLIAHMDVSNSVSGEHVEPIIHANYAGQTIELPGDRSVILDPIIDSPLGECQGLDIITSSGTTLLGADDKAGIAIIMAVLRHLIHDPDIEHGPVRVAFTPDEEIGRGVDKFDLENFGAEVAYTLDGEGLGEIEDETFCADAMDITLFGISVHPGFAKNKMINSVKLAAEFLASLPQTELSPETTANREGYVHPRLIEGNEEKTVVKFLIRDFELDKLAEYETFLEEKARAVVAAHPGSRFEKRIQHSYKNMRSVLDQRPEASLFAEEAVRAAGLRVVKKPIRGGTDGARLAFMGLPTPNIFTGGHNYHGKKEWIAIQHMEKSAEVCLRLLEIWGQRGEKKGLLPAID